VLYVYRSTLQDPGFNVGFSTDLKGTLADHIRGVSSAAKHRGPLKLIYYEAYVNQRDAKGHECYLKSSSGRRFFASPTAGIISTNPSQKSKSPLS